MRLVEAARFITATVIVGGLVGIVEAYLGTMFPALNPTFGATLATLISMGLGVWWYRKFGRRWLG